MRAIPPSDLSSRIYLVIDPGRDASTSALRTGDSRSAISGQPIERVTKPLDFFAANGRFLMARVINPELSGSDRGGHVKKLNISRAVISSRYRSGAG
jgi:hypothetical protein